MTTRRDLLKKTCLASTFLLPTLLSIASTSKAQIAQNAKLRILIPEHWRVVKPFEAHDRGSVVPRRLWFYDMLTNFQKKYPNIKLELEPTAWDQVTSIFTNKTLAGDAPDITFLANGSQYKLASAGYLHPLNGFNFDWSDYNANILRENMTVDGKIYLVPGYTVPRVLFYNKALLAAVGASPPKTWDEMIATAKKMTRHTNGGGEIEVSGLGLPAGSVVPDQVYANVEIIDWLLGGDVAKDGRALFDTRQMHQAIQLYVDLVDKYQVMPRAAVSWDKDFMSQFRNERLAMTIIGAEEYVPSVAALGDKVGMARIPTPMLGGSQYTWTEIWGFVMSKQAGDSNPDAAWAFLNEFSSRETFLLAERYEKGLPTRRSVASDPIYTSDPIIKFLADYVVDAGRADPYMKEFQAWGDLTAKTVEGAVLKLDTIDNLLKNAQSEYDARLKL